jgi:hypothetical protein
VEILSTDNRYKLIKSPQNLGFGRANNLAYGEAKGKYIFLLNSDTYLLNNAIKIFFDEMESCDSNIACLGSILKCQDEVTPNNSYSNFPSIKETLLLFRGLYTRIPVPLPHITKDGCVDYVIGADLMIRRSVIDELGLFSPDFFMYYEESEMQFRYNRKGYKSKVIDTAKIVHLEGASFSDSGKKMSGVKALMYFRSMRIYMKKRYHWRKYILFKLLSIGYLPIIVKNNNLNYQYKIIRAFYL